MYLVCFSEQHPAPPEAAHHGALPGAGRHRPHNLPREPAAEADGGRVQDSKVQSIMFRLLDRVVCHQTFSFIPPFHVCLYRRYREERALPPRFLVQTSAQSNASLAPKAHSTQTALAGAYIPKYQTSAQVRTIKEATLQA